MNREQRVVKRWIHELEQSGGRAKNEREKFRDFCEMVYSAYAKLTAPTKEHADKLEANYMRLVGTYHDKYRDGDTVKGYPKLLAIAFEEVSKTGRDFLGIIAAELNVLNPQMGQYFTPMNITRMMAKMNLGDGKDAESIVAQNGYITVSDPCAGSGAMLLAFAEELESLGADPTIHMLGHAIELNPVSFHMCFIQLTWAGIPALVIHGNSLSMETFQSAWTPPCHIFVEEHGHLSFDKQQATES